MLEHGTVDLAARREKIQRAFTISVKEKDAETQRKRLSLLHDARLRQQAAAAATSAEGEVQNAGSTEKQKLPLPGADVQEDVFSTPAEEFPQAERELTIDTARSNEKTMLDLTQEDSPTLGLANNRYTVSSRDFDDSDEPQSAATTGTAGTFFDNEAQESPEGPKVNPAIRSILAEEVFNSKSPSDLRSSGFGSDRDDLESIQIMLREEDGYDPTAQRQSSNLDAEWNRSSIPTTPRSRFQQPWSPESTKSINTLDSESYNTITKVLDSYHGDPGLMSPENISEFQQRLFSQSPNLARKGGWDPKKVTQLYLQSLAYRSKNEDPSALPKPLNVHANITDDAPPVPSFSREPSHDRQDSTCSEEEVSDSGRGSTDAEVSGGLRVPSPNFNTQRASLNNPEDWANTSPSMLDWIHHQALDTPTDGNDDTAVLPSQEWIAEHERSRTPREGVPTLPGIPRTGGGLGIIDINIETPQDSPSYTHGHPSAAELHAAAALQNRATSIPKPHSPTPEINGKHQPSSQSGSFGLSSTPDVPSRTHSDEALSQPPTARRRADTASQSVDQLSLERPSISSAETPAKFGSQTPDQKLLTRRRHILKELVDTESSFGQDMTVVVDIYKGTSNVILNSPEDVKILFGNAHEIVEFSTLFLDALKTASKSVYVLPKSKRWKSKRDSNATTGSTNTEDLTMMTNPELNDDEKDRMTSIGQAFHKNLDQMEKIYTEYLKNHDAANQKLQQLQKSENIKIWLKECRAYAHDLTTAWDLDSLLVKPVQRILKYPLLLKELLEATPENHPDFVLLDSAAREMVGVSRRINEAKKRADLVEQVNGVTSKKRKDFEGRLGFPKAFGRRTEKFKQQVGLSDVIQDREYNTVSEKFGSHFFQLQVVMRDVEMYVMDVQSWVNKFNDVVLAIEAYMDVGQTTYPEVESKWRRFRLSIREIQMTALTDHVS